MKTLSINGITFQVITPRKQEIKDSYTSRFNSITRYKNLCEAYQKPSHIKRVIYNEWYAWYSDSADIFNSITTNTNRIYGFGISSFNFNQFTLTFKLQYNDNDYLGIITKSSNRLIKIN